MRAIVGALKGRVRAIMTVDSTSLHDVDGASNREGPQWKRTQVILNGPLVYAERNEILSNLFERCGESIFCACFLRLCVALCTFIHTQHGLYGMIQWPVCICRTQLCDFEQPI